MKSIGNYMKRNWALLVLVLCLSTCAITGMILAKYADDNQMESGIDITAQGVLSVAVSDPVVEGYKHSYTLSNRNDSNVPVYVRAAVLVNWQDSEGNLWAVPPKEGSDYIIEATSCTKLGDYYYYNDSCEPSDAFQLSVNLAAGAKPPVGYTLHVTILAEGIQCIPENAASDAWGVTFNGTAWSSN